MSRSPLKYFLLVFVLSIPIWVIGGRPLPGPIVLVLRPINFPMTFVPLIAALILVYREEKRGGTRRLLRRVLDQRRIRRRIWYGPIIFLMPLLYLLTFGVMRVMGLPLPDDPYVPYLMIPLLFVLFFILAMGEEVGWTGYVTDPLQERWSALTTGIILGLVTSIWHFVPLIQMGRTPTWIAWWSLGSISIRILTVWLYNNTGRSLFAAIIFHAMVNLSFSMFPNYGSHWDPAVAGAITAIAAVIVTFLWGSRTLGRYRYA